MTGTSIDGIDAALVAIDGVGLDMTASLVATESRSLGELAPLLRELADQSPMPAMRIATIARDFALLHAEVCAAVAAKAGRSPDLICVHGQTVCHAPPISWQLMSPAPIAAAMNCPVVFDVRSADIARGGQGAPLTPIADLILFGGVGHPLAVVNLGGFCNVTLVNGRSPDAVRALDVCACNLLLDRIARSLLHAPRDEGGAAALSGEVHHDALIDLEGIFAAARAPRKSLGADADVAEWVSRYRVHVPSADLAATACEAIAGAIAREVGDAEEALLAGGGVKNAALFKAIGSSCACRVANTDSRGVPGAYREAIAWAVLGALCQDRVPIGLAQVTGCRTPAPIAGAWVYA